MLRDGGSRYPHPFQCREDGEEGELPRTLLELGMCTASSAIREKPNWHLKMQDETIRAKWKAELLEQQNGLGRSQKLTEKMVSYIIYELKGYAAIRDEATGIELGPCDKVYKSDSLIPDDLRNAFREASERLSSIPDAEKDWHPRSDGQVLDLIHPSLYPLVYGQSVNNKGALVVFKQPEDACCESHLSKRFQWLPSDFNISSDGTASLKSPYINNLDQLNELHAPLYPLIDRMLTHALPLFSRVLSDLDREEEPLRVQDQCIWDGDAFSDHPLTKAGDWEAFDNIGRDGKREWAEANAPNFPDIRDHYKRQLHNRLPNVSLANEELQIIVKMANIHLTPEKPKYAGGAWHVEAMQNESIVSTFIYYYDSENISESSLAFRRAVCEPHYHMQDDEDCMQLLYGFGRDDPCVQDIGRVLTPANRCIAFPNLYQHCVSPFELAEKTKPGHRKILALFLVDPGVRAISTSDIRPQQHDWIRNAIARARTLDQPSLWKKLPVEIVDAIVQNLPASMSRTQAESLRLELMDERTSTRDPDSDEDRWNDDENGFFNRRFNMCEH